MRNVILVDFPLPGEWEFQAGVQDATAAPWEVISLQSNQNHGGKIQNLIRYGKYFALPLHIFLKKAEYSRVIAWQQFFGLILAFYLRLFHSRTAPGITVMTFIYNPKRGWIGKLYHAFVRYAVSSDYIKRIIVFSERERTHYAKIFDVPQSKFEFTHLSVEDMAEQYRKDIAHGEACVSPGRSNRDYDFLRNAWEDQERELRIICDTVEKADTGKIIYLTDCHGDAYLRQLAGCHAVIVPLKNENISSGQLVLLHAMMLGKPVIVTKNNAVIPYVQEGVTGFVIEKTPEALTEALRKLEDSAQYEKISVSARAYFEQNYSMKAFGTAVGKTLCDTQCAESGV